MLLILTNLKHLKQKVNKYKRIVLIFLIVFFFLANYQICNYFYPLDTVEHIENWWLLKVDIYVLIISLCLILCTQKEVTDIRLKSIEHFIAYMGTGFAISTFIDKRIFGTREYTQIDLLMVIVVLIASYYDVKKLNKLAKTHAENER